MASRLKLRKRNWLHETSIFDSVVMYETEEMGRGTTMAGRLKLRKRNWLHETRSQETARRIQALEHSLQSAHERINELDQHISGLALLFGSKAMPPTGKNKPLGDKS